MLKAAGQLVIVYRLNFKFNIFSHDTTDPTVRMPAELECVWHYVIISMLWSNAQINENRSISDKDNAHGTD